MSYDSFLLRYGVFGLSTSVECMTETTMIWYCSEESGVNAEGRRMSPFGDDHVEIEEVDKILEQGPLS